MNLNPQALRQENLEATVARLVAQALRACGGDLDACKVDAANVIAVPAEKAAAEAGDSQVLGQQVISVQLLESLKHKTAVLEIGAKAVVTPAAQDWLRQHSMRAVRVAGSSLPSKPTFKEAVKEAVNGKGAILLADTGMHQRAAAVVRQLSIRGLSAEATDLETLVQACQNGNAALGLVVSPLPAIELDLLSRIHSVRAATADSVAQVRGILARFSPRAWVLDAERSTLNSLVVVAETCIRNQAFDATEGRR